MLNLDDDDDILSSFNTPLDAFYHYFHQDYIPAAHPDLVPEQEHKASRQQQQQYNGDWWKCLYQTFITLEKSLRSEGYTISNNEDDDIDEVHTNSLLLLTLPYVIADSMKHYIDSTNTNNNRTSMNLIKIDTYLKHFINMIIHRLKLISPSSPLLGVGDMIDAVRDAKISRRKEEQQLKRKYITKAYHHEDDNDEEIMRECYISLIKYFTLLSVDEDKMLGIEIECLKRRESDNQLLESNKKSTEEKDHDNRHPPDRRRRMPWVVRLGTGDIVGKDRLEVMNGVFKPDIPMPTMTLDEWAAIEQQNMMKSETINDDDGISSGKEEEEEELKARKWDDWKDDHPRGSGNKMANIG